jgi:hypothetical protein
LLRRRDRRLAVRLTPDRSDPNHRLNRRWIIAPLSAVAAAAQSFGRSPEDDSVVPRRGPREIAQVANALNVLAVQVGLRRAPRP